MKKAIMQLDELTCPACLTKIEHAISAQNGVTEVKVLFNAGKVKAKYDGSQTDADKLSQVVTDLGYEVEHMKVKDI